MKVVEARELVLEMKGDVEIGASEAASAFAASAGMGEDAVGEIQMAVLEACINAAEHSEAADCCIYLRLRLLADVARRKVEISVSDHGVGIPSEVLERGVREQPKRAPRKRGWGLTIIRGLMDEVEIDSDEHGTTVTMAKWL